ncbi:hypothetical protein [Methylocystis heyeri]|uniref:Uncharacterized protein n=1 Tax=Methylocystis heyeri TaxID=391905 RepID=A0A6B8KG93_9HYPH|nr:hypothetical protein [Methylocystis heyeri]QGM47356.1 hypothetical protein H2LOC_017620 [Methylocystis heyeri]
MLFAIDQKYGAPSSERVTSTRTAICVAAICLLASTPLLVSFALMAWAA